jgi:hypothetical protein
MALELMAEQTGRLGIHHLNRLWSSHLAVDGARSDSGTDWVADSTLMAGLRLNLRETYDFLLQQRPSFAAFEAWILEKNGGVIDAARIERLNGALSGSVDAEQPADRHAEPALTPAELEFWDDNGYVVLHEAVPPANCHAATEAICGFLGVRLERPDTWYRGPQGHSIWIPLLHHPALWANRDSSRIHRAFAQLWNREEVWVNVDQAGFNPPEKPGWKFPGPHLHWDVSLARPIPFGVQGILYLTDVAADQGAFTCVPGFHRRIDAWLQGLPEGANPREQDLNASAIPIAGRAGDLVIWHHALPHGSSPNRAATPRIVQYLQCRPGRWGYNPVWL